MTLPPSWNTVRVFGVFKNFDDGSPCEGAVTFDPVRVVTAPEGEGRTIVMPRPRQVQLDAEGKLDIQLPATDDTDLDATGWVYKVTERIAPANRSYFIAAPLAGGEIDLATVVPLVPPPLLESTIGPPGKSAYQVAVDNGFVGSEADWLASLAGGADLSNAAPAALAASASPGTSAAASRGDHVHPLPTPADIGAEPAGTVAALASALGTAAGRDVGTAAGTVAAGDDARLSNAREWTAETVTQAEAEAGTDTARKAWSVQRVWQAIAAWWAGYSSAIGRSLVTAADAAAARAVLGVGAQQTPVRDAVQALFVKYSAAGGMYDLGDPSTMYQSTDTSLPAAPGKPLGRITDLSGNGNHIPQVTTTARPLLTYEAGSWQGRPDGVDDVLAVDIAPVTSAWTVGIRARRNLRGYGWVVSGVMGLNWSNSRSVAGDPDVHAYADGFFGSAPGSDAAFTRSINAKRADRYSLYVNGLLNATTTDTPTEGPVNRIILIGSIDGNPSKTEVSRFIAIGAEVTNDELLLIDAWLGGAA